jgi:integrase
VIRRITIKNYQYLEKHLRDFSKTKNFNIRLRRVHKLSARELKAEKQYWKKFYLAFSDYYFNDLDVYDNYAGQNFKLLRAFFNYLNSEKDMGIGDFHERFYITREEIPVVVISPERLNFLIYDKEFEKRLTLAERKFKKMLVLGCTVALRFSDLVKITWDNIERTSDSVYLVTRSQKTGFFTRVKLPDYAVRIIDGCRKPKKRLFGSYSKFYFNRTVKGIAFKAGWTEDLPKVRTKRGVPHFIYRDPVKRLHYRFCDMVSSHTMRRTAITTMLRLGMEEIYVRKISGHSPLSGSFNRYVEFAGAFVDEQLDKVHKKLSSMRPGKTKKAWEAADGR